VTGAAKAKRDPGRPKGSRNSVDKGLWRVRYIASVALLLVERAGVSQRCAIEAIIEARKGRARRLGGAYGGSAQAINKEVEAWDKKLAAVRKCISRIKNGEEQVIEGVGVVDMMEACREIPASVWSKNALCQAVEGYDRQVGKVQATESRILRARARLPDKSP
jgi:hypothetical protein